MMKKMICTALSALMLTSLISCAAALPTDEGDSASDKNDSIQSTEEETRTPVTPDIFIDFEDGDGEFTAIFADYPKGSEEFFELESGRSAVPVADTVSSGLYIKGNNHSDDLFMGFSKKLTGFSAGEGVHFTVSFKLATRVEGGMIGIGGSPGESVIVKCGIVASEPRAIEDNNGYYRMNIETGVQSNAGKDMKIVGNLSKQNSTAADEFEYNTYTVEIDAIANENGELWLIIATDSGFEGTSEYYLDDVSLSR